MSGAFLAAMLLLGLASGSRVIPITPERRINLIVLANAGRLTTYSLLGAASGWLGGELTFALGAQTAVYLLANAMLLAVGLHLAGATRLLGFAEKAAAPFWRAAAPLLGAGTAYVPGLAWGFVPCGLVYGALAAAAFAGSAAGGIRGLICL
jgi:sulfite exporter TauE/SafE